MMIANFDKDYMKHHFKSGFLMEFNRYTYYQSNSNELKKSLDNVIEDINRILDKDKLDKKKLFGTKIQKKDFKSIIEKACLEDDEDLLIQIYEESNSNDNIISKIKDLKIKKYTRIITYINECLEINELKKLINNQNVKIEEQNVQIEKLNKDKNVQSDQLLKLNEKINELNKQRENQDDNIEQLNKKVGYMEIILNALISRKVINHSINKFLSKYKDSLKKTKKQIKKDGKIIEIPYISYK